MIICFTTFKTHDAPEIKLSFKVLSLLIDSDTSFLDSDRAGDFSMFDIHSSFKEENNIAPQRWRVVE